MKCAVALDSVPMCSTGDEICVDGNDTKVDGAYMSCSDCRKYVIISQGKATTLSCPAGFGFSDETRRCEKRSPNCVECSGRLLIVDLRCWSRTTPAIVTHIKINHLNLISIYVT